MNELVLKYGLLNAIEKNEVIDFIDFLLSKKKKSLQTQPDLKTLPQVSVWQDEDTLFYTQIRQNDRPLLAW
jgi:hypothetical protein